MDVFGELSSLFCEHGNSLLLIRRWWFQKLGVIWTTMRPAVVSKYRQRLCFGGWWKTCCHRRDGRCRQARGLIWVRDPVWNWRGVRCLWWCRKSNSGKEQRGGNQCIFDFQVFPGTLDQLLGSTIFHRVLQNRYVTVSMVSYPRRHFV